MTKHSAPETSHPPELSRSVPLQALREHRRYTATITATADERVALARRFGVMRVDAVQADIVLKTIGPDLVRFNGTIHAAIVQACGVSLEPVEQTIDDEHEEILTTSPDMLVPVDDMVPDDNSPTELIEGDTVDYGEIVAQVVALLIDPFPRKAEPATVAHIEHNHNPFAALQALKKGEAGEPAND